MQLLSAVDEVRKLIEVVGWELQAAKATEDFLAETHRLLDEAQQGLEEADQPLSTETPTQQLASLDEDGLSSTKPCPRCARDVKTAAKFCPFCGYQLPDLVERV